MDTPEAGLKQRIFAWAIARFNTKYERFVSRYKRPLFAELTGTVLKIGPGTGVEAGPIQSDFRGDRMRSPYTARLLPPVLRGGMFWLSLRKFSGSYFDFTATSRSQRSR
jgi:hypothetical protein